MNRIASLTVAAMVLSVGSLASAQTASETKSSDKDGSYEVKFKDDLLAAPGIDSSAPTIRVRLVGIRTQLLRPRVQFISEMLKSVESL